MAERDRIVELAWEELKCIGGMQYQGQVVRARLQKMSPEVINMGSELHRDEFQWWADGLIQQITTPDGQLQSSSSICSGFREHFKDLFAREPDLQKTSFQDRLADFLRLEPHKAARYEGLIMEGVIVAALR